LARKCRKQGMWLFLSGRQRTIGGKYGFHFWTERAPRLTRPTVFTVKLRKPIQRLGKVHPGSRTIFHQPGPRAEITSWICGLSLAGSSMAVLGGHRGGACLRDCGRETFFLESGPPLCGFRRTRTLFRREAEQYSRLKPNTIGAYRRWPSDCARTIICSP